MTRPELQIDWRVPMRFHLTLLAAVPAIALAAPVPKDAPKGPEGAPTGEQIEASQKNLRMIGLAMHNYLDANNCFPSDRIKDKKALLSWRVAILPYLEQDKLYNQFKLDEPWDSEHNLKLIEKIPKVYEPVRGNAKKGETFYQSFNGPGAFLEPPKVVRLANITDGTSLTLMVVEAGKAVPWTKPADLPFDPAKQLPALGGMFEGNFHMLTADGAIHRMKKGVDPDFLKKVITISGGEVVPFPPDK
jgi:hypothetical protein